MICLRLFTLLALLAVSCSKDCDDRPPPPWSNPSSVSYYNGAGDYRSVTYTYGCYDFTEYVSVTYATTDGCYWNEVSSFRMDCGWKTGGQIELGDLPEDCGCTGTVLGP